MARGYIPLVLIAFGIFVLCGVDPVRVGVSLLLGACYSLLWFQMIGRNAVKASLYPPAQGTRIVRRGYVFRYLLTGTLAVLAIKAPFIHPIAALLPLFFPRLILLCSSIFQRKGG
jgi:hypothetical protein